jgi:hypothetical protein
MAAYAQPILGLIVLIALACALSENRSRGSI